MMTKLRRACVKYRLRPAHLIGLAINPNTGRPYSKNHIYALANGETGATQRCIGAIVIAFRKASGDASVTAEDLFDFAVRKAS
jgi:hypothetical protein